MRKLFLTAALAVMCAAILTGCGSSSDKDGVPPVVVTPINLTNPDSLVGTYSVSLFYTNALGTEITNDCNMAVDKGFMATCNPAYNVLLNGEATVAKDAAGDYVLRSKVQMGGGIFTIVPDNMTHLVTPNQYNYTLYKPVPPATIDSNINTINTGVGAVKGTTGRNVVALSPDDNATYTYKLQDDGSLLIDMIKTKPLDVPTKVILHKTLDTPGTLNPNEAYATPAITGFVPDVGYAE